jgi:2-dehydro-3-deoxyphosphogluconate aldolase/(4S)-4-hydroxy-2-oxoglutarate aldolase
MPTGGVEYDEKSLTAWFKAGVACVGMGSNLITKALLDKQDYAGIEANVRDCIALIRKIRGR